MLTQIQAAYLKDRSPFGPTIACQPRVDGAHMQEGNVQVGGNWSCSRRAPNQDGNYQGILNSRLDPEGWQKKHQPAVYKWVVVFNGSYHTRPGQTEHFESDAALSQRLSFVGQHHARTIDLIDPTLADRVAAKLARVAELNSAL